jgi:hypothetical protein
MDIDSEYHVNLLTTYLEAIKNNQLPNTVVNFLMKDPEFAINILRSFKNLSPELLISALHPATESLLYSIPPYELLDLVVNNEGYSEELEPHIKEYLDLIVTCTKEYNEFYLELLLVQADS